VTVLLVTSARLDKAQLSQVVDSRGLNRVEVMTERNIERSRFRFTAVCTNAHDAAFPPTSLTAWSPNFSRTIWRRRAEFACACSGLTGSSGGSVAGADVATGALAAWSLVIWSRMISTR
jgi:hypothetical protein